MTKESTLFKPTQLGPFTLSHRVVLAPLTRLRAVPGKQTLDLLGESHALYYAQRTSPGALLIGEASPVSAQAGGFAESPGLYTRPQLEAWKKVVDAVHAKGGIIFAQLWFIGMASPKNEWEIEGKTYTRISSSDRELSDGSARAMTLDEIKEAIDAYVSAAKGCIEVAGFDGVEVHGANGYLLEQFLKKSVNKRTDQYGGSLENRLRFPLEVIDAVVAAVGDESKVGLRVSPYNVAKGIIEEAPLDTYVPFLQKVLEKHPRFAYIHAVESRIASSIDRDVYDKTETLDPLREVVTKHVRSRNEHEGQGGNGSGTKFIAAGGYTPEAALEASDRHGDLVAFGRYFISNPDLPERIKNGWEFTPYDRPTFYTNGNEGYIDYPTYEEGKKKGAQL